MNAAQTNTTNGSESSHTVSGGEQGRLSFYEGGSSETLFVRDEMGAYVLASPLQVVAAARNAADALIDRSAVLLNHPQRVQDFFVAKLGGFGVEVLLIEALRWLEEDEDVLTRLVDFPGPVVLAVNKVDRIADKTRLLPFLEEMARKRAFAEVVPLAALQGDNVAALERAIAGLLPVGERLFPEDQVTTVSERFLAAELVREKLTRLLREELPYALTVDIERFVEEGRLTRISAVIWVERETQKGIVIGQGGATLREAGKQAREALERLLDRKVFLQTWVKVREGWSDDERALRSLGYGDPGAT